MFKVPIVAWLFTMQKAKCGFFMVVLLFCSTLSQSFASEQEFSVSKDAPKPKAEFNIFDGMRLAPRISKDSVLSIDFYSNVSLWYGLFDRNKFRNPTTPFYEHLLGVNLITPKAGFIDTNAILKDGIRTMIPIANVDEDLAGSLGKEGSAQLTVFYNNPYVWLDAPSFMNFMTILGLVIEATASIPSKPFIKEGAQLSEILNSIETASSWVMKLEEFMERLESVAGIVKLLCDISTNEIAGCNKYIGNIETGVEELNKTLTKVEELIDKLSLQVNATISSSVSDNTVKEELNGLFKLLKKLVSEMRQEDGKISLKNVKMSKAQLFDLVGSSFSQLGDIAAAKLVEKFLIDPFFDKLILSETESKPKTYKVNGHELTVTALHRLEYKKPSGDIKEITNEEIAKALVDFYSSEKKLTLEKQWENLKSEDPKSYLIVKAFAESIFTHAFASMIENAKSLDFVAVTKILNAIANFTHTVLNLHQSIINADSADVGAFLHAISKPLVQALIESGVGITEAVIKKAIVNNLGIAKIAKITTTVGNKGTKILFDFMTKPSIVNMDIERKDVGTDIKFTFKHPTPELDVIRYLEVENDSVLDFYALAGNNDDLPLIHDVNDIVTRVYPTHIDPGANHFLVKPGFKASVEAHAVLIYEEEKQTLGQLLKNGEGKLLWHVYKYEDSKLPNINQLPHSARFNDQGCIDGSYFVGKLKYTNLIRQQKEVEIHNCIYDPVKYSNWFLGSDPFIKLANLSSPIVKDYIGQYSREVALDFSEVYRENHVGVLVHKTPGVYSSVAGFMIGGTTLDESDVYLNTFHSYVLKDWSDEKESKISDSKIGTGKVSHNLTVPQGFNVLIEHDGNWYDYPKDGKALNLTDEVCDIESSEELYLYREYLDQTSESLRTIVLPSVIPVDSTTKVFLYDDILRAWINTLPKCDEGNKAEKIPPVLHQKLKNLLASLTNGDLEPYVISFGLNQIEQEPHCNFSDNTSGYYTKSVISLCKLGVLEGYEDGSFKPHNEVTRAEFLKMALLASPFHKDNDFQQTETSFSDVLKKHWASGYIEYATNEKIIEGFPNGEFKPDVGISRVAAAKIVAETFFDIIKLKLMDIGSYFDSSCPKQFTDVIDSEWYCKYIRELSKIEILKGHPDGTFKPATKMTRAETATVVCRAYSYNKIGNTSLCDIDKD